MSGDNNWNPDVFVHDRVRGETLRVSVASDGTESNYDSYSPSISSDGRYVAFHSASTNIITMKSNHYSNIFVHDVMTGETQLVSVAIDGSPGNGVSFSPSISSDGRYVAFESNANNLVEGDTNVDIDVDIFIHDRETGETMMLSISGRQIPGNDNSWGASISSDGRYIAFMSFASNLVDGDTNGVQDAIVHDRGMEILNLSQP